MAKKNNVSREVSCFQVMMQAVMLGIRPKEYAEFYEMVNSLVGDDDADIIQDGPFEGRSRSPVCRRRSLQSPSGGLKDASEKTLKLRVQMKDVTKPPMWRELKVPADFTFFQLHKAIQAACGFYDSHLWVFQRKAYDPGLQIGIPSDPADPYEMGLEECTHDACEIGITTFLAEKGQKLVYVYDFGDDWIFDVSVVDITSRDGETAVCTRWKSDLQPMEDSGGVWSYLSMRQAWTQSNSLTKRQKADLAASLGYDSFEELVEVVSDLSFDPEAVNEALAEV